MLNKTEQARRQVLPFNPNTGFGYHIAVDGKRQQEVGKLDGRTIYKANSLENPNQDILFTEYLSFLTQIGIFDNEDGNYGLRLFAGTINHIWNVVGFDNLFDLIESEIKEIKLCNVLKQSERIVTNAIVETLNILEELAKNPLDCVQNAQRVKSLLNFSHVIHGVIEDETTFDKAYKANRNAVLMSTGNKKLYKTDLHHALSNLIDIYDEQGLYGRRQRNLTNLLQDMAWTVKQDWQTKDEELEDVTNVVLGFSDADKFELIYDALANQAGDEFNPLIRQFTYTVPSSNKKELAEFCAKLRHLDEEHEGGQLYQSFIKKVNEKLIDHNLKCLKGVADFRAFLIELLAKDEGA